jgi:hypothetical protein
LNAAHCPNGSLILTGEGNSPSKWDKGFGVSDVECILIGQPKPSTGDTSEIEKWVEKQFKDEMTCNLWLIALMIAHFGILGLLCGSGIP